MFCLIKLTSTESVRTLCTSQTILHISFIFYIMQCFYQSVKGIFNSFFTSRDREPVQTAALTEWITEDKPHRQRGNPLVQVTHQVNITALTGVFPRSGEIVVARFDAHRWLQVLGRLFPATAG